MGLDSKHEAMRRRKAYDAHLKTDILATGKRRSMNATFDPYYHHYGRPYGYGYGHPGFDPKDPRARMSPEELQKLQEQEQEEDTK